MIRGAQGQDVKIEIKSKPIRAKSAAFFMDFMQIAPTIEPFATLLSQIQQDSNIRIKFIPAKHSATGGSWESVSRTISIADNLRVFTLLDTIIFELCNANNVYMNSSLLDPEKFDSAKAYAYANEHSEYFHTQVPFQKILAEALKAPKLIQLLEKYGISKKEQQYSLEDSSFPNFAQYLQAQLETGKSGHSHFEEYCLDFEEEIQYKSKHRRALLNTPNYLQLFELFVPEKLSAPKDNKVMQSITHLNLKQDHASQEETTKFEDYQYDNDYYTESYEAFHEASYENSYEEVICYESYTDESSIFSDSEDNYASNFNGYRNLKV